MIGSALINLLIGIVLVAAIAYVLWPRRGLLARLSEAKQASLHVASENLLKAILKAETAGRSVTLSELAGTTGTSRDGITDILQEMEAAGLVTLEAGAPQLLPKGRDGALHIVRAHRIWERHLADRTGVEEEHWHDEAEQAEHFLTPEAVRDLSAELGHPTVDPHGDPIPPEGADLWAVDGVPITKLKHGDHAQIVHLEDEPPAVYAQLVAEGLTPGMVVHVVDKTPEKIHFWAEGSEVMLAPIVAANVTVRRVFDQRPSADPQPSVVLSDIAPGQRAKVIRVSRACRGLMRRRLLDLGVVPGTIISVEREAPGGDPVAYRIRGAEIALRAAQTRFIQVEPVSELIEEE